MFLTPLGPPVPTPFAPLLLFGVPWRTTQGFRSGASCNVMTLEGCHKAWDIAVPIGTEVLATHSGQVVEVSDGGNCGKSVVVESHSGRRTRYCHLSQQLVQQRQEVKKGDVVARSGNTGTSTGPHLHVQYCPPGPTCQLTDFRMALGAWEAVGWIGLLAAAALTAYALR
jgi:murein DD-endopeptidase MepM/ murein hydrolase activator NlpD